MRVSGEYLFAGPNGLNPSDGPHVVSVDRDERPALRLRKLIVSAAATALVVPLAPGTAFASPGTGPTGDDAVEQEPGIEADEPPQVTYTYEIQTQGQVHTSPSAFAASVGEILGDARGWTLGGSVAFGEVASGGDFNLILASPQAVDAAHEVCSPQYSCRVGDDVYINDDNWRNATSAWWNAGGDLATYRDYLINHEVGHYLGFGHFDCTGAGEPAPVMQQQSISLDGCEPNGWPLAWERDDLGERLGVPVYDWAFVDVLRGDPHQGSIHALASAGVTTGYTDQTYRANESVDRAQTATFLDRALSLEPADAHHFDDVHPESVHAPAINAAAEAGIVEGYDDQTFGPDDRIARGQMASMLARAYGYEAEGDPPFEDVPPHHPHAEGIAALAEAGVVEGFGDGTFGPGSSVTRGQMSSFIVRADPDV